MSAQAANVVPLPSSKRSPQAQPVAKHLVFERVRALICEGELNHIDLNVVQYIAQITGKSTGVAHVSLAKIAERIGRSRPTVVRSIRRLIDACVIDREPQRAGNRCFTSVYRLIVPAGLAGASDAPFRPSKGANDDTPRFTDVPTPVHQCTTSRAFEKNPSPNGHDPYRGRVGEIVHWTNRDWDAVGEWLATHGKLARWAPGPGQAWSLVMDYLDRWREQAGDAAVIGAIERAKRGNGGSGWFGDYLIERLSEMLSGDTGPP